MASGDSKFSPDQEDAIAFVTTTSRKAAITVREGQRGGKGREELDGGERGEGEMERLWSSITRQQGHFCL